MTLPAWLIRELEEQQRQQEEQQREQLRLPVYEEPAPHDDGKKDQPNSPIVIQL